MAILSRAPRPLVLALAALLAVLATGCVQSGERRLVSLREGDFQEDTLTGEIVYVETLGVRLNGLYVRDMSTGDRTRLNTPDGYVNSPAWSPDGQHVAYSFTNEEGFSHLFVIDAYDPEAEPTRLTDGEVVDDAPRWSPDARRIVFASIRDGDFDWRLHVLDLDTDEIEVIGSTEGHSVFPDWSPDGRFVVYSNRAGDSYKLRVYDLETGEDRQITEDEGEHLYARFSPDGNEVVYASDADDGIWQIYVHDLVTGDEARLIGSDTMDQYPEWSPDQEHVVFSAGHLAVYRSDGEAFFDGKLRWRLSDNLAWSPDWKAER